MTEKVVKSPGKMLVKNAAKAAKADDASKKEAAKSVKEVPPASKVALKTASKPKEEVVEASTPVDVEDDLIVQTAKEIEGMKEEKAFKMVPNLLDNIEHDYFRLGGILAVIQSNGWFMDRGFDNFKSYIEAETGMAYRKAMYLIAIYNGLVESGVKWEQVKHLGWTKLKDLAPILTPDNVDEWVGIAENMTVIQLQEHIKEASKGETTSAGEVSEESTKTTTITFKVHADQKTTVREALDKCKHETGTDVDSVALEHICLDYLGGESKLAKIPTLAESMAGKSAEEVLGVFGEVFPDVTINAELPE